MVLGSKSKRRVRCSTTMSREVVCKFSHPVGWVGMTEKDAEMHTMLHCFKSSQSKAVTVGRHTDTSLLLKLQSHF